MTVFSFFFSFSPGDGGELFSQSTVSPRQAKQQASLFGRMAPGIRVYETESDEYPQQMLDPEEAFISTETNRSCQGITAHSGSLFVRVGDKWWPLCTALNNAFQSMLAACRTHDTIVSFVFIFVAMRFKGKLRNRGLTPGLCIHGKEVNTSQITDRLEYCKRGLVAIQLHAVPSEKQSIRNILAILPEQRNFEV